MRVFDVTRYGALSDGVTDSSEAIAAAIAAASAYFSSHRESRPVVLFPPGNFLTRPFNLSSSIILQIDGTILAAVGRRALQLWPRLPPLPTYGRDRDGARKSRYQALLMAFGASDLMIRGHGTVDGQGAWWWRRRHKLRAGRPHCASAPAPPIPTPF